MSRANVRVCFWAVADPVQLFRVHEQAIHTQHLSHNHVEMATVLAKVQENTMKTLELIDPQQSTVEAIVQG